ncbi:MAG TPA: type IV toxin-antitoxin system AbiEi family antitoxin domain-containing protein [Mycobacteriales bacterium]|nr:type IV toxin-antitoxin system AbiEi family antitoxin domain-containing protein [Mycobacteriales bacterium]
MPLVPAAAATQGGVFTFRQALAAGTSESGIRAALADDRWQRVLHGVYAPGPASLLQLAWAARLRCPRAVISHASAADLMGFGIRTDRRVHVIVPPGTRMRGGPQVVVHRLQLASGDVAYRAGLPLTSPIRTLMDLAREWELPDAVAAADAALGQRRCSREELLAAVEVLRGVGAPRARTAIGLARVGAQSPQETRLRLLCREAGLPEPTLQLRVILPDGRSAFLDLGWRRAMAGLDFDGREPHLLAQTFVADRRRHNALQAAHFDVRIVTGTDLRRRADTCVQEWRAMLGERWGCGPADGREWSDIVFS